MLMGMNSLVQKAINGEVLVEACEGLFRRFYQHPGMQRGS